MLHRRYVGVFGVGGLLVVVGLMVGAREDAGTASRWVGATLCIGGLFGLFYGGIRDGIASVGVQTDRYNEQQDSDEPPTGSTSP